MLARVDERLTRIVSRLGEIPGAAESLMRLDSHSFKHGLTFVAAILALRGGADSVWDELLERAAAERDLLPALSSALTWVNHRIAGPAVLNLLDSASPFRLQLGIDAGVARGMSPGSHLERALDSDDPAVRTSALRAVGRLPVGQLRARLNAAFDEEDSACRFWAAWSAVRLGDQTGLQILGQFARKTGEFTIAACDVALRAVNPEQALRAHHRLRSMTANEPTAIIAAGIIGQSRLVSGLLDAMESPVLARRAGAAFCLMTGCDLRRDDLDARPPAGSTHDGTGHQELEGRFAPVPDIIGSGPDEELVWPDAARLKRWWGEREHMFLPGVRYIAGVPATSPELTRVLSAGNQWQRAAAAMEIALLNADAAWCDVTAPSHCQTGGVSAQ
jgi:uncharacterized protein (TIGR02270 family)